MPNWLNVQSLVDVAFDNKSCLSDSPKGWQARLRGSSLSIRDMQISVRKVIPS